MKLILFTSDLELAKMAEQSGIDSIMVDWEQKTAESEAADGPVDTVQDLVRLTTELVIPVSVRINGIDTSLAHEIDLAIANGAQYIMLPMARNENDVIRFLDHVDGRVKTIVQIETGEILGSLDKIHKLPWDHAYIGMIDLAASRGDATIWSLLLDNTIEHIMQSLEGRSVGFGGITVVGGGKPVPLTMLLNEMTRLKCDLSFMRRSFKREITGRDFITEINMIREQIAASCSRTSSEIRADHSAFIKYITDLLSGTYQG